MDENLKKENAAAAAQDVPEGAVEIPVEVVENEESGLFPDDSACAGEAAGEPESIESLRARLDEMGVQLEAVRARADEEIRAVQADAKDQLMRSQAEFENYRKRLSREHDEHLKYAAEKVMKDLIPTLDNLEMAVAYGGRDEACANMLQGVQMTQKLLLDAVAKHGLVRLGDAGETFDPAKHEAIGCESNPELAPETVARVMQSGYSLHGRLLRPAKVMVNRA